MPQYILVIDQGTTGTAVSLVNAKGIIEASFDQEFPQIYPQPGWVEHDALDIWKTVVNGIQNVMQKINLHPKDIYAIGITNQRETTVAWDSNGSPLHNAIVWQCRRTSQRCHRLKQLKWNPYIKKSTGLVLDPYFSGTKMEWLLKNSPKVKEAAKNKALKLGTIDSFLLYKLTQGASFKTDVSNASRTLLMNLEKQSWDKKLLKLFGINEKFLPTIEDSTHLFGITKGVEGLLDGTPIYGMIGDQQAALFGQVAFEPGDVKITYGTGSFILLNTGNQIVHSKNGLLTTLAWRLPKQKPVYALEGGAFICGAAVQWLRDNLNIVNQSHEIENLALEVEDSGGIEFIPAFVGLGAPYWEPEVRGVIMGLTRGVTKAHIARATLEAMALQNNDILEVMVKESKNKIKTLRVDGGASQNNLLMKIQSDYLGVKVVRPRQIETTTLGAAFMAGLGSGLWKSTKELKKIGLLDKEFKPSLSKSLRTQRVKKWKKAISNLVKSK